MIHMHMKGRSRRRRWTLLVLAASMFLLLAACSPAAKDGAAETTTEPSPTENAAEQIVDVEPIDAEETDQRDTDEGAEAVTKADVINPDVVAAHNKLGLLIHAHLADAAGPDENVFISPLSISLALSIVYNGAAGETAEAMAETLHFDDLDLDAVNEAHRALLNAFSRADDEQLGIKLHVANALWHREGFALRPEFLEQTDAYYRAVAEQLDFDDRASVDVINDWVSDKTEGLIDNLVERLDADLVMLVVNTVYFKGDWTSPFDPALTRDGDFTTASGKTLTVPLMYQDGRFDHFSGADFEAVRLPYGDDEQLAMYVFLPNEDSDLATLREQLTYDNWNGWLTGFSRKLGEVTIPRIDIGYKVQLNEVLDALGMGVAFDAQRADFSPMLPADDSVPLSISEVVHQSVLKVDEEGTEAAAATSVGIRMTSMPMYDFRFTADRPFFLAIRDDAGGELLFIGSIADPSAD